MNFTLFIAAMAHHDGLTPEQADEVWNLLSLTEAPDYNSPADMMRWYESGRLGVMASA